jgi:hypothetical protein
MRGEYVSRNITLERKRMRRSSSSGARTYLLKAASRSWMKCRSSDILTNKKSRRYLLDYIFRRFGAKIGDLHLRLVSK